MALIDGMLQELDEEARTTRRVLERVPDNQLAWRPHEKARTLGELALHVAMVPGAVAELIASQSPAQAPDFTDRSPKSASELIPTLDQSIAKAKKVLGGIDDAALRRSVFVIGRGELGDDVDDTAGHFKFQPVTWLDAGSAPHAGRHHQVSFVFHCDRHRVRKS